ncbi:MAG: GrpB family protein [Anaerolineaceae bacterium]|nr:GrpB family protein [Anaerolineaceae bacterium]
MPKNLSPIVIESYCSEWPEQFTQEAKLIQCVIGNYITVIEHIGSTAVPGLAAKPIIDMLIGVKSLADSPHFIAPLQQLGYVYVPEHEAELPERRYLYKQKDDEDTFHLHMVEPESEFFRRHIAFRDYLRSHPEAVAAYASLKLKLAREFGSDRSGYTDAKTEFIQSIEKLTLKA